MNWELVKDLPDNMIAVYYLDGKKFIQLDGKIRLLVKRPDKFQYNGDYKFCRLSSTNIMIDCFTEDELIFFVKDSV